MRGDETLTTMNATQRLIDCMGTLLDKFENDGCVYPAEALTTGEYDYMSNAIAAAKEEQATGLDVVSDAELELQFRGTNFGGVDPRQVLDECLRSTAKGYAVGSTIRHIATNLGLIEQQDHDRNRITDKGLRFLTGATGKDEPVAWMTDHPMLFTDVEEARSYCDDDEAPTPLYAHPPTTGLDVEGVMEALDNVGRHEGWGLVTVAKGALSKALEAHIAENRGGNLRKDPWISVEDRLPDMDVEMHGAMVSGQLIAMMDDGVAAVMQCQRRMDDGAVEWFDGVDVLDGVTHWMPLPSQPDTDKG